MNARDWIDTLQLEPHPEGGYYREIYHASTWMNDDITLDVYGAPRRSATSIYFLIEDNDVSHFHRLKSDELWFYHAGDSLAVHTISPDGTYQLHPVGLHRERGEVPQLLVPKNTIFGSTVEQSNPEDGQRHGYALVSCVVSPGFDFADFELFTQSALLTHYPNHEDIIRRLAMPE